MDIKIEYFEDKTKMCFNVFVILLICIVMSVLQTLVLKQINSTESQCKQAYKLL